MASDVLNESHPPDAASTRRPLVLAPFRGLRFNPDTVGDLGTVVSPPYDVLDAETVRELEATNRRNIVRLILSRRFERPYVAVRKRLESWRTKGYLVADEAPALYLYQYTVDRIRVRGLVGLVALRREDERVILPHEDVMTAPVEDRSVLMRTTETNLEPILLVHEGTSRLRDLLEQATTTAPPLAEFSALDASHHQLWAVRDPETLARIAVELEHGRALIADGHHRYAAYLHLQGEERAPGSPDGSSPWDYGLAMLVDQNDYPLGVGPIHRSVAAMTMSDVHDHCLERGDDFDTFPDRESAFAAAAKHADDPGSVAFVLSDGRSWAVLTTNRSHAVDAAVLHEVLFEDWHIAEEQVGYHHSIDQALHTTARQPGIVVAVTPPDLRQVMDSAAHGVRMPRKSTSFTPKPRMGVVMRDLRDS
ncbi:MAG TPA: DUF1015 domain-containing protein [Nocardioidaceae bacterium]|nr:DUF1015 domain-containing protein [Nocardioidaceae bacterium]